MTQPNAAGTRPGLDRSESQLLGPRCGHGEAQRSFPVKGTRPHARSGDGRAVLIRGRSREDGRAVSGASTRCMAGGGDTGHLHLAGSFTSVDRRGDRGSSCKYSTDIVLACCRSQPRIRDWTVFGFSSQHSAVSYPDHPLTRYTRPAGFGITRTRCFGIILWNSK
jgi:hypothetical protein